MSTTATRPTADRTPAHRPAPAVASSGSRIDPIRVVRQNQTFLLIAAVIGVAVGVGAKLVLDSLLPLYKGAVVFELRPPISDQNNVMPTELRSEEAVERSGNTEAQRILDRTVLETAMRSPDIENTRWSQNFRDDEGKFKPDAAVDNLLDGLNHLDASYQKRTLYFKLTWKTGVPEDVPIVLNKIADTYLLVRRQADEKRFADNRSVFKKQLDDIDKDIADLQRDLGEFIRSHNITSLNENAGELIGRMDDIGRKIGETQGQLSIATSKRDQTKNKMEGRMEPTSEDIRKAEEDPVVIRLSSTVKDLAVQSANAKERFGPTHPEHRNAVRLFEKAEAERDIELKRVMQNNLYADFKEFSDLAQSYGKLLKEYQDDYASAETKLKDFSANMSELKEKQDRQARLQEQRSEVIKTLSQVDQLKLREDARSVVVAARATLPREKDFPQWKVFIPAGAILGLGLMFGIAFLRELLDQRVRYTSDFAGMPLRVLGTVPDVEDDPTGVKRAENAIREAPQSVVAETLRQTTAQIQKQMRSGGFRTLLVLGGMPGAGTTSILTNLAESMAWAGKRVVLVDANFRRPGLAAALGTDPNSPGLGEVLAGKASIENVVRQISERVQFINAGAPENRVFERLSTPIADETIGRLRELYDVVLIDAPPAVVSGDALVLAAKVDSTVLVVRAFQEQRGLVSRLAAQLNDSPSAFLGVILNRPRQSAGGYFRKNFEAMASYAGKA
ncbi:MAG: hypothetical protein U0572_06875 [Phycisphaerales bacterium]